MLKLQSSAFGSDEDGNEVLMAAGDSITEIEDAGPVINTAGDPTGWEVTCRFTPDHKQWPAELVTIDAVKLLKALEK